MIPPFSPEAYVAALERLRPEVEHNDADLDLDHYLACAGLDVAAGELVQEALEAELDPWRLVDVLVILVHERADNHPDQAERSQAQVLLALMAGIREVPSVCQTNELSQLVALTADRWKAKLVQLALDTINLAMYVANLDAIEPEHANALVRQFVRHAYELGGLDMVRRVVERLRELLAST